MSKFKFSQIVLKNFAINIRLLVLNVLFLISHFIDQFHKQDDILLSHGHGNVLSFCGEQHNLRLKFEGPNDGATSIEYNSSTSRLGGTSVHSSKMFVPITCKVCITIVLETFVESGLK